MMDLPLSEVVRLIDSANADRAGSIRSHGAQGRDGTGAERQLDELFGVDQRLAVYGTLAPGRSNHHVVAHLVGKWSDGIVEGILSPEGWGATLGYPAFRPRAGGDAVAVHVLTAGLLASAWPSLDRFEGPGYRRILVPVFTSPSTNVRRLCTVANLYAAVEEG